MQQKEANMLILCDQSKQAYTEAEMQDEMREIKSLQPFMMKLKEKDNNPRICWILVRGGNILKWKGRIEYANIFMPQSHFFLLDFFLQDGSAGTQSHPEAGGLHVHGRAPKLRPRTADLAALLSAPPPTPPLPPPPTRSQLHSAGHEDSLLSRMPPVVAPTKVDP